MFVLRSDTNIATRTAADAFCSLLFVFHVPNISQLDGMFVLQSDTNIATQTAADAFCREVSSTGCQARG
jgi:hypothetical protein